MDHRTFLPAEHPAQLSTFSQVILLTPTSLGRLFNHQTAQIQLRKSALVCKYTKTRKCALAHGCYQRPSHCQTITKGNAGLPRMPLRESLDTAKQNGVIANLSHLYLVYGSDFLSLYFSFLCPGIISLLFEGSI